MRPWVGQLTLATIARRCAGSGKGNFAPRLQVEPLLADRLGAADVANSSEEVPSWKEVASQAEEGAEENVPLSIKERRLIEAALKPVTVLPQTPEPPRRLKIPVETGRRPYLPNSELEVLRPATSKESGPTGQASSFPTGLIRNLPSPVQRPKDASGAPARTRQIICGVLFKDFVAVSKQEGHQLRGLQREKAVNFSRQGEIIPLVRHFRRVELSRIARATTEKSGEGALSKLRVIVKPGGEQAIVGLFLDDELSWERAREHLHTEAIPERLPEKAE